MATRTNLVIVRANDDSRHESWLEGPGEERNWDLVISYYGKDPHRFLGGDWIRIDCEGFKYKVLHDLILSHEAWLQDYGYFVLADDDLVTSCREMNRFFDICREVRLDLAQPALTYDSFFSHTITLWSPFFRLRETTFVEVMTPCFSGRALRKLLPSMLETVSSFGMDTLWPHLLGPEYSVGIVDEVQVRHTRPLGSGVVYRGLAEQGVTPQKEWEAVLERHRIEPRYAITSAITRSGRRVSNRVWLLCLYGAGLLRAGSKIGLKWSQFPRFWLSAMYQQVKGPLPRR